MGLTPKKNKIADPRIQDFSFFVFCVVPLPSDFVCLLVTFAKRNAFHPENIIYLSLVRHKCLQILLQESK